MSPMQNVVHEMVDEVLPMKHPISIQRLRIAILSKTCIKLEVDGCEASGIFFYK